MRVGISIVVLLLVSFFALSFPAEANGPAVKKSKSGICHKKGSTYYARTKKFTSYPSMKSCLKSGGRRPKR
ncbi:hypothetical protein [Cognaticolwellia mytili]|uniref:hypothetical protein n=1 Tax=Cognaticolwellia mytili TaxID=1888913 RepID=UPI000A174C72|nr:hypothetical protein [Cognaticolwellia mytili]